MRRRAVLPLLALARIAHAQPGPDVADATADPGEVIEVHGSAPVEPDHDTVSSDELHTLPGAGNDALRGLTSLPGVARIPFGLGGLALRGAAPHDTRVYLDGIEVPILYHFGGVASVVPIDAVDHVELMPSGAGAAFGGGIGGVVLLDSRSPRPTRWLAAGEVSLLHAGVLAVGPGPAHGSWMIGLRRSYIDAVLAAAQVDLALAPSYLDAQLRWESGDKHWLAIAFASDDDLHLIHDPNDDGSVGGISGQAVKSFDYNSRFFRAGMRYHADGVTITPWVGRNDMVATANHLGQDKGYWRTDALYGVRGELARPALDGTLHVGLETKATYYDYRISDVPPPGPGVPHNPGVITRDGQRMAVDAGLYAEEQWLVAGGHVEVRPGLRFDWIGLADQPVLDPRLSIIERTQGAAITESIGIYHQSPLVTDLDPIFGNRTLAAPQSLQASISGETPFFDLFTGKATLYAQQQDHLPVDVVSGATPISANGGEQAGGLLAISRELVDQQFGSYSYRDDVGRGASWGLELMARRDLGKLTGWLAYTYARAWRTGNPATDPAYYPYVLDQPHVLTALATRPLGAHWRLGGRFRLASGNPITPVARAYYDTTTQKWMPVDGPLLSQRLPTFAELDLRLDRQWRRANGTWILYIDIQNVTNRANAEGVTYSADYMRRSYTTGLPILPSIGVEYRP